MQFTIHKLKPHIILSSFILMSATLALAAAPPTPCPATMELSSYTDLTAPQQAAMNTVNQFHCGLASNNTPMIMDTYYKDKDTTPFLLTNVPTDVFESSMWPCQADTPNGKDASIAPGQPIFGLENLEKYQNTVFDAGTFSNLTSKLWRLDMDEKSAVAITYGTYQFTLKDGTKKYTQDTAMWALKKNAQSEWKVTAVNFINKLTDSPYCPKSKKLSLSKQRSPEIYQILGNTEPVY